MNTTLLCPLAVLSLLAMPAMAEHGWGVFGSGWVPSDGSGSLGVGARLGYEVIPTVILDARATWYEDVGGESVELRVIPIEGAVLHVMEWGDQTEFSLGVGLGYYQADATLTQSNGSRQDVSPDGEIGYFGLLGIEHSLRLDVGRVEATRATVFAEAMYRVVEIKDVDADGFSLSLQDANLDGPALNLGFRLRW